MSLNPSGKKKQKVDFTIAESVKVKKGIMCPDYQGLCLENYQGRVTDFGEDENGEQVICVEWDSVSLKNLPEKYIKESIREGLGYQLMFLSPDELEQCEERDTEEESMAVQEEIHEKYKWSGDNGEEQIIRNVVKDIEREDYEAQYKAWNEYIEKNIVFPFEAEIIQYLEKGPLRHGDIIKVNEIAFIDEQYGIAVEVQKGRKRYSVPLCDLKVTDEKSKNYISVGAYIIWFANQ